MVELTKAESRQLRQRILDEISEFCQSKKLTYFLSGSTLLGAIRNKGLIPWNDRVSIMMPRADFDEMERVFNSYAKEKGLHLRIITAENANDYGHYFAKVVDYTTVLVSENENGDGLGVSVCVVAIDGLGNNKKTANKIAIKSEVYSKMLAYKTYKKGNNLDLWAKLQTRLCSKKNLLSKINSLVPYSFEESNLVGVLGVGYKTRAVVSKSIFKSSVLAEFEGKLYPVPNGYDEYLQALFDDYMSLPPENERNEYNFKVYSQSKQLDE